MKMKTYKGTKIVTTVQEYTVDVMAESKEAAINLLNGESSSECSTGGTYVVQNGGFLTYSSPTDDKPKSKAKIVTSIINATEIDTDITIEEYKINK